MSLHLCRFDPPHQIVGKARKRPFERLAAATGWRAISINGLCNGPTPIVLETTTIPISESVPCQAVAALAPEKRPAE